MVSNQNILDGVRHRFFFPASSSSLPVFMEPEGERTRLRAKPGECILLVDDEDSSRLLIRMVLEALGYDVIEALNGGEALEIVQKSGATINLVLTDLMISVIGGKDVARNVMEQRQGLKVIFMMEHDDDQALDFDLASKHILRKPFTVSRISQVIREVLDA